MKCWIITVGKSRLGRHKRSGLGIRVDVFGERGKGERGFHLFHQGVSSKRQCLREYPGMESGQCSCNVVSSGGKLDAGGVGALMGRSSVRTEVYRPGKRAHTACMAQRKHA